MNEPVHTPKEHDHGKTVILASTIVILTCILSCAATLIVLIMRTT